MVAGARGTTYMRRRAEILRSWPPCPDCDGTVWFCATCNGMGRVPPPPPVPPTGDTPDGDRACLECPSVILPKTHVVKVDDGWLHPGCWAARQYRLADSQ